MRGSPKWSVSLKFPHQKLVYASPPSPTRSTRPAHLVPLDLIIRKICDEEYRPLSSSLCSYLHSPVTSSLLGPNILLNTLFSNTLSLRFSHNVSDQVSHPYKTTGKIIFLYILRWTLPPNKTASYLLCNNLLISMVCVFRARKSIIMLGKER